MLVLLSPAKTLDFSPDDRAMPALTAPRFADESATLVAALREHSVAELRDLMHVSESLARDNAARYAAYDTPASLASAKPALLAFRGDVYRGFDVDSLDDQALGRARDRLRILSGLYGLLRPFDLIQPYRLEMGTRLAVARREDLYGFWGDKVTDLLRADIAAAGAPLVLDLASREYVACLRADCLGVPVVPVDFKERRGGGLKFITYNAKLARGRLARLVLEGGIDRLEGLRELDVNGYQFDAARSTAAAVAFTREG